MELLSTKQVALWLGISQATVKRWTDAGRIECVRTRGGHRKFRKHDVRELLGGAARTPTLRPTTLGTHRGVVASCANAFVARAIRPDISPEALIEVFQETVAPRMKAMSLTHMRGTLPRADYHSALKRLADACASVWRVIAQPPSHAPLIALTSIECERPDPTLELVRVLARSIGLPSLLSCGASPTRDLDTLLRSAPPACLVISAPDAPSYAGLATQVEHIRMAASSTQLVVIGPNQVSLPDVLWASSPQGLLPIFRTLAERSKVTMFQS